MSAIEHVYTSPYNPRANSIVERFHRTFKNALLARSKNQKDWIDSIPYILLALRNTPKADSNYSPAQLTFFQSLRLPCDLFSTGFEFHPLKSSLIKKLQNQLRELKPFVSREQNNPHIYLPKDIDTCKFVFIREGQIRPGFSPPYKGPFRVLRRFRHSFLLQGENKTFKANIRNLKVATVSEEIDSELNVKTPPKKTVSFKL